MAIQTSLHLAVALTDEDPVFLDVEEFQRIGVAGFIDVEEINNGLADLLPPARISDLGITVNATTSSITLTWTAVGSDYNVGQGNSYH